MSKTIETKEELLANIGAARELLDRKYSFLTDEQLSWTAGKDKWSVKDVLAHIVDWEQRFIEWYQDGVKGRTPAEPAKLKDSEALDKVNQKGYKAHKNESIDEVLAQYKKSHTEFIKLIEGMTESEIFYHNVYPWTGNSALLVWILDVSSEHYTWARRQIKTSLLKNAFRGKRESRLERDFPEGIAALKSLYTEAEVDAEMARMNEVFKQTEYWWQEYLSLIPDRKVKYLMIDEAPPCDDDEEIQYIFNPAAEPRTLITAVTNAFFDEPIFKEVGYPMTLAKLAEQGFLMIDLIPFAMPFSKSGKRSRKGYTSLIESVASDYFLNKINEKDIKWNPNLKIAFSMRKTAEALMEALPNGIPMNELRKRVKLNEEMVGVNGANYPDANKLKEIYELLGPA